MSIFNTPFNPNISDSLTIRQELMGKQTRTPKELTFLNSKTNWVSLKSGVDINLDDGALAKANVLTILFTLDALILSKVESSFSQKVLVVAKTELLLGTTTAS